MSSYTGYLEVINGTHEVAASLFQESGNIHKLESVALQMTKLRSVRNIISKDVGLRDDEIDELLDACDNNIFEVSAMYHGAEA